ncbi:serine carboxypeptidase-like 11 isoform X2 [Lactuca sativa]|uniref:serine carboxypeptidase-like 11 isoform X2 n=1 Tax=Lactuca sativa TaxID=4236 RepID=UPI0022AE8874|nr:serine carboxypeptidase-like 11 isoform X2 [Lactuca sativa]
MHIICLAYLSFFLRRNMKARSQYHIQPWHFLRKSNNVMLFGLFMVVVSLEVTKSGYLVKTLPGFPGDLPFLFETGYISVGKNDDVQYFYYFFESERSPENDPLLLWVRGGPGCGVLTSILLQIGPITINYINSSLENQMLELSTHSLTKVANILFLDEPAGSGFSYAKSPEGYITNDTLTPIHIHQFIRKSVKQNCHGEYQYVDPNNNRCIQDLQVVHECIERISVDNILYPFCDRSNTSKSEHLRIGLRSLDKTSIYIWSSDDVQTQWLCNYKSAYIEAWASRRDVKEALHVSEELNEIKWVSCNQSLTYADGLLAKVSYKFNIMSTVAYHQEFSHKNCRALVYSGDHDLRVPHFSTLKWIESINLLLVEYWRPWYVDEQVAGYTMKFSNHDYKLTFATVKGGSHTSPENRPEECFNMFIRWFDSVDL